VRVEPVFAHHGMTVWGVRSDLIGGLPRQQVFTSKSLEEGLERMIAPMT
jgi:hypothetical protein